VSRRRLSRRFERALVYANQVHRGQIRKGTSIPYITHPLAVCALVLEDGGSEAEAIAALLHDAAEDQGGKAELKRIRRRFGRKVARIVEGCSEPSKLKGKDPGWKKRKKRALAHLAAEDDPRVLRVMLADKLHNARTILDDIRQVGDHVWDRFNAGRDDQLWYYRRCVDAFRSRAHAWPLFESPMVAELERTVRDLERVATAPGRARVPLAHEGTATLDAWFADDGSLVFESAEGRGRGAELESLVRIRDADRDRLLLALLGHCFDDDTGAERVRAFLVGARIPFEFESWR
jgi:hypothetical protein